MFIVPGNAGMVHGMNGMPGPNIVIPPGPPKFIVIPGLVIVMAGLNIVIPGIVMVIPFIDMVMGLAGMAGTIGTAGTTTGSWTTAPVEVMVWDAICCGPPSAT